MSLINQMLQELDARGAPTGGEMAHQEVRAVPSRQRAQHMRVLVPVLLIAAALLLAVVAWILSHPQTPSTSKVMVARSAATLVMTPPTLQETLPQSSSQSSQQALTQSPPQNSADAVANHASGPEPELVLKLVPDLTALSLAAMAAPSTTATTAVGTTTKAGTASTPPPVPTTPTPVAEKPKPAPELRSAPTPQPGAQLKKEIQVSSPSSPSQRAENDYRKAIALAQQGRANDAISALEQVLLSDSQHWAGRQSLVALLLEQKRHDEAITRLQDGLALDPAQTGLAMILARVQVEKDSLHAAIDTLQQSLPHAKDRADYQAFLGALFQRDKRHKEAAERYKIAVRIAPANAVWWMGLGISLQAENNIPAAQDAFNRAKTLNTLTPQLQAFVEQNLNQMQK